MSSLSLQDRALRELGRTIVNYQRFEVTLKAVTSRANVFDQGDDGRRAFEKLQTSTSKKTLGQLVNQLADTIYGPSKEMPEPDMSKGPHFSSEFRMVFGSEERRAKHIEELQEVILSRNILVHVSAGQLDLKSDEACLAFIAELKELNNKLKPFHNEFRDYLQHMNAVTQLFSNNPELLMPELGPRPDTIQIGNDTFHKKSQS